MGKRKRGPPKEVNFHDQKVQEENRIHPNSQAAQGAIVIPQKRLYRQRPHVNVFADHNLVYPSCPAEMDWHFHFPNRISVDGNAPDDGKVEFADVGCGFGGLLFYLAPLFPEKLMVGMEIRTSVTQYVFDKVRALRAASRSLNAAAPPSSDKQEKEKQHKNVIMTNTGRVVMDADEGERMTEEAEGAVVDEETSEAAINHSLIEEAPQVLGKYDNISALRVNAMKFLPNFFTKGQLSKIFFLHPDPHFKQRKNKNRIISSTLLAEYAYILRPGGILYTITDVEDLHLWMVQHLDDFPLFVKLSEEDLVGDVCVDAVWNATEEGKKVIRNKGSKWFIAYRRVADEMGEDRI